jgi:hypothetical protein
VVGRGAPEGRVAVTLAGTVGELARALCSGPVARALVAGGDPAALALLRDWVNRARSG